MEIPNSGTVVDYVINSQLDGCFFQSSAQENGREGKSIEKWFGLQKEDLPCQPVKHSFIK